MSERQEVINDERSESVRQRSQSTSFVVMSFLLLVDVIYRSLVRNEASWDLLAIVVIGGFVSAALNVRQGILTKRHWRVKATAVIVAALIAGALALWLAFR